MTVSTHTYTAVLTGSPDRVLSVKGGRLVLDAGQAPHVQGQLRVSVPIATTLALLDPRLSARIRVTATSDLAGSVSRTFNLGLRSRAVLHRNGEVTLPLAGDEALLEDYAPLADDTGAFASQASLRAVCNYVLGKVLPGTTLAASPATDVDITTYSDSTNLFTDPAYTGSAGGGYSGTGATLSADTTFPGGGRRGAYLNAPTGIDSYLSIANAPGAMSFGMQAGRTYTLAASGSVRSAVGGSVSPRARRLVVFYRSGTGPYTEVASDPVPTTVMSGTNGTRVAVRFTLPVGTTEVFIRAYLGHTAGSITWGLFRLSEASDDVTDTAYYDGATAATAGYTYTWTGTANASTTARKALISRPPAGLLWKAGQNALQFIMPIVQAAGLRLVCDEQRTWTLRDENYSAPDALAIRHGVNLIDATDTIDRAAGLWFDAQVTRYTWTDAAGMQQVRTDAYALNTPYTRLNTVDIPSAYPGPGRSQYAVRRAQGRGREVSAVAVADWRARAEQPITIVLEGAPTQIGQTTSVTFDLDRDEMTVTTRTTDTPAGAIDLLVGTIDSLTGTIDSL